MWSRWDMQEAPPDILITNYSMLNIMLMRDVEASIFDMTRAWLQQDEANVFHLVVDELHSYRGTPGTEVGYILRVLYERLGLHPDHSQLRIIASSASLGGDLARAHDYLLQFFGRSRPFTLIHGNARPLAAGAAARVQGLAAPLARLGADVADGSGTTLDQSVDTFAAASDLAAPPREISAEQRLGAALSAAGVAEALLAACNGASDENPSIVPRPIRELGRRLFAGDGQDELTGAAGAIAALSRAQAPTGTPLLPIRVHVFFRNVQGIWACTNPDCPHANWNDGNIRIGRLYDRPTITCPCGSRILELLYCEPCGDLFLGGYRRTLQQNVWSLVPDDPNIEKAPDHSINDRSYENYAVYWPALRADGTLRQPQRDNWGQEGVARRWSMAAFDHRKGEMRLARRRSEATGWIYHVPDLHRTPVPPRANAASAQNDRPSVCPHCEANWASMANAAPIRTQRTGFQKTAQVLADSLLREIAPAIETDGSPPEDSRRKLVLFSDSRQDAAKLSVGVAKSHWLDALRQAVVEAMESNTRAAIIFEREARNLPLSPEETALARRFSSSRRDDARAIIDAQHSRMRDYPSIDGMIMQQHAGIVLSASPRGTFEGYRP